MIDATARCASRSLHFLLLGAALFALYRLASAGAGEARAGEIVVDARPDRALARGLRAHLAAAADAATSSTGWSTTTCARRSSTARRWRWASTATTPIVRRRMRQKIEFLAEDAAAAAPTDAELPPISPRTRTSSAARSQLTFRRSSSTRPGAALRYRATRPLSSTRCAARPESVDVETAGDRPARSSRATSTRASATSRSTSAPRSPKRCAHSRAGAWFGPGGVGLRPAPRARRRAHAGAAAGRSPRCARRSRATRGAAPARPGVDAPLRGDAQRTRYRIDDRGRRVARQAAGNCRCAARARCCSLAARSSRAGASRTRCGPAYLELARARADDLRRRSGRSPRSATSCGCASRCACPEDVPGPRRRRTAASSGERIVERWRIRCPAGSRARRSRSTASRRRSPTCSCASSAPTARRRSRACCPTRRAFRRRRRRRARRRSRAPTSRSASSTSCSASTTCCSCSRCCSLVRGGATLLVDDHRVHASRTASRSRPRRSAGCACRGRRSRRRSRSASSSSRARSRTARAGEPGLTARAPWLVAFAFGLLHGLGFAGALREVGLPAAGDPARAALPSTSASSWASSPSSARCSRRRRSSRGCAVRAPSGWRTAAAYGIGAVASYWLLERLAAF